MRLDGGRHPKGVTTASTSEQAERAAAAGRSLRVPAALPALVPFSLAAASSPSPQPGTGKPRELRVHHTQSLPALATGRSGRPAPLGNSRVARHATGALSPLGKKLLQDEDPLLKWSQLSPPSQLLLSGIRQQQGPIDDGSSSPSSELRPEYLSPVGRTPLIGRMSGQRPGQLRTARVVLPEMVQSMPSGPSFDIKGCGLFAPMPVRRQLQVDGGGDKALLLGAGLPDERRLNLAHALRKACGSLQEAWHVLDEGGVGSLTVDAFERRLAAAGVDSLSVCGLSCRDLYSTLARDGELTAQAWERFFAKGMQSGSNAGVRYRSFAEAKAMESEMNAMELEVVKAQASAEDAQLQEELQAKDLSGVQALAYALVSKFGSIEESFEWFDHAKVGQIASVGWYTGMQVLRCDLRKLTGLSPSKIYRMMCKDGVITKEAWLEFFKEASAGIEGLLSDVKARSEEDTLQMRSAKRVRLAGGAEDYHTGAPTKSGGLSRMKRGKSVLPRSQHGASHVFGRDLDEQEQAFQDHVKWELESLSKGETVEYSLQDIPGLEPKRLALVEEVAEELGFFVHTVKDDVGAGMRKKSKVATADGDDATGILIYNLADFAEETLQKLQRLSTGESLDFPASLSPEERQVVHLLASDLGYFSISEGRGAARHVAVHNVGSFMTDVRKQLTELKSGGSVSFPAALSVAQRKVLHLIASELELWSHWEGEDDERHLVVCNHSDFIEEVKDVMEGLGSGEQHSFPRSLTERERHVVRSLADELGLVHNTEEDDDGVWVEVANLEDFKESALEQLAAMEPGSTKVFEQDLSPLQRKAVRALAEDLDCQVLAESKGRNRRMSVMRRASAGSSDNDDHHSRHSAADQSQEKSRRSGSKTFVHRTETMGESFFAGRLSSKNATSVGASPVAGGHSGVVASVRLVELPEEVQFEGSKQRATWQLHAKRRATVTAVGLRHLHNPEGEAERHGATKRRVSFHNVRSMRSSSGLMPHVLEPTANGAAAAAGIDGADARTSAGALAAETSGASLLQSLSGRISATVSPGQSPLTTRTRSHDMRQAAGSPNGPVSGLSRLSQTKSQEPWSPGRRTKSGRLIDLVREHSPQAPEDSVLRAASGANTTTAPSHSASAVSLPAPSSTSQSPAPVPANRSSKTQARAAASKGKRRVKPRPPPQKGQGAKKKRTKKPRRSGGAADDESELDEESDDSFGEESDEDESDSDDEEDARLFELYGTGSFQGKRLFVRATDLEELTEDLQLLRQRGQWKRYRHLKALVNAVFDDVVQLQVDFGLHTRKGLTKHWFQVFLSRLAGEIGYGQLGLLLKLADEVETEEMSPLGKPLTELDTQTPADRSAEKDW